MNGVIEEYNSLEVENNEIIVRRHSFEEAKNNLKKFSETTEQTIELPTVKEYGWFFEHKVTGSELNEFTSNLQEHLIRFNEANIKLGKEFGQVYNALEALDKEYIQGILISIKATEKTSEDIKAAQKKIKKTADGQKRTIEVLKKFKDELNSYKRLKDIDMFWEDFQISKDEMKIMNGKFEGITDEIISHIKTHESFIDKLNNYKHIKDIDILWEDFQISKDEMKIINGKFEGITDEIISHIKTHESFIDKLNNYKHLRDIDILWENSQIQKDEIITTNKKFEVITDENISNIQMQKNEITITNKKLECIKEENKHSESALLKKIKTAYILAGSASGVALISLTLALLGII